MSGRIECLRCRLLRSMIPSACKPVSLSVSVSREQTAEQIEVLLGLETLRDPRNIVLHKNLDFSHGFDAVFAKLLWLLLQLATKQHFSRLCKTMLTL